MCEYKFPAVYPARVALIYGRGQNESLSTGDDKLLTNHCSLCHYGMIYQAVIYIKDIRQV